ncbi:hypothetical protein L1887_22418 [Cichorium endivia]|nr:hypothetical protein L1887_22418 [Cichorium endivia]
MRRNISLVICCLRFSEVKCSQLNGFPIFQSRWSYLDQDNPDSPNCRRSKALDSKPDKSNLQMRDEKRHESESEFEFESTVNSKLEDEVTKVENDVEFESTPNS